MTWLKRWTMSVLLLAVVFGLARPAVARGVRVTISPDAAVLITDQSRDFTALVEGTARKTVRWRICDAFGRNCVANGNAQVGTLVEVGHDSLGNPIARYTAPHAVPSLFCQPVPFGCRLSIKVKLVRRPEKKDWASITVYDPPQPEPTLSISPQDPEVALGGTIQFSATVTGADPSEVFWTAGIGTITQDGLYTAPRFLDDTDTVRAILRSHSVLPAFSRVHLTVPTPSIEEISPSPAAAGDTVTVHGSNFYGRLTMEFTGPNGIPLSAGAHGLSLNELTVTVPHMTVSGPVHLVAQVYGREPLTSNAIPFSRLPRLRIRAESRDIALGESTRLFTRFLGEEQPRTVVWSAERGSVSGDGVYQAPAARPDPPFDRVTGCIEGTGACDSLLLGLHHFRIDPVAPIVKQGDSLHLAAFQGSVPVSPAWALEAGGGVIQPDGIYIAPIMAEGSGGVPITATWAGQRERTSVAVAGAFPGLVNRVSDYIDLTAPWPAGYGTFALNLALCGDRGYVIATDSTSGVFEQKHFWIDVYDLADPARPVWIDAVESAVHPDLVSCDGNWLYEVAISDFSAGGTYPATIGIYDVRDDHPVLVARSTVPALAPFGLSLVNGVLYASPRESSPTTLQVYRFDLRGGTVVPGILTLPLVYPGRAFGLSSITGSDDRLYLGLQQLIPSGWVSVVAAYDLSASPPTVLGAGPGYASTMRIVGRSLLTDFGVYDLSGDAPVRISQLAERIFPKDVKGSLVVADTLQTGLRIIDMSDPTKPTLSASLFDTVASCRGGGWAGSLVLCAEGGGGIAVFDAETTGGLRRKSRFYAGGGYVSAVYDQVLRTPYLFTAGASDSGAVITVTDVSGPVAQRLNVTYDQTEPAAFALALGDETLYVGLVDHLKIFDVSAPEAPRDAGSYPLSVGSLLLAGNILYVGTLDGRLVMMDVADPQSPKQLNEIPVQGVPIRIVQKGAFLFVAAQSAGLLVYEVSAPTSPVLLAQYQPSSAVYDVEVDGTLAFLAAAEDGLVIADVSDPTNPVLLSRTPLASFYPFFPVDGRAEGISVGLHNGIAFVGTLNANGIVCGFDYGNPVHPRVVALTAEGEFIDTWVARIGFQGDDAFISGFLGGVSGVSQNDASQPRNAINSFFLPEALRYEPPSPITSFFSPDDATEPPFEAISRCPRADEGCRTILPWALRRGTSIKK